MVLKSSFPDIDIPKITLNQYLLEHLERHGDAVALVDAENESNILTYKQVREKSLGLAISLKRLGITKGDVVAICVSNCIEYPVLILAAAACGAISTTCNPNYTEVEIQKQLTNCQPKIIFTDVEIFKMKRIMKAIKSAEHVFSVTPREGLESLHDLVKKANYSDKDKDLSEMTTCNGEDVAMLPYSSGTTGLPKGVMLTHRNLIFLTESSRISFGISKLDTVYSVLPMFHIFGTLITNVSLIKGAKLMVGKRFFVESVLKVIQKHKITYMPAAPPMLLQITKSSHLPSYDISSLKQIICGAASVSKEIIKLGQEKLKAHIFQGWGLTEAGKIACGAFDARIPSSSVGFVVPNTTLKVVDVESGLELQACRYGEILVKGPQVMKGYLKNPTATLCCIDKDGWLHTGDLGYYDHSGCVYVTDRLKELIKYKGFQVPPAELEEVLLGHPKIADAAVIGVPDNIAGELPKAFVVRQDTSLVADDIHKYIEGKVASYKYLRGGIVFCDTIPKNPSGKILRRKLKVLQRSNL